MGACHVGHRVWARSALLPGGSNGHNITADLAGDQHLAGGRAGFYCSHFSSMPPWPRGGGKGWRDLAGYLALAGWLLAAFVSYRAAGDQWDNPRYRTSFLLIYAVVTGWAWTWARTTGSRWLRHTMVVVAGVTVLFLQWYAGRYLHLPSLELFPTLALVVVFIPGYLAIAWMLERRRKVRG